MCFAWDQIEPPLKIVLHLDVIALPKQPAHASFSCRTSVVMAMMLLHLSSMSVTRTCRMNGYGILNADTLHCENLSLQRVFVKLPSPCDHLLSQIQTEKGIHELVVVPTNPHDYLSSNDNDRIIEIRLDMEKHTLEIVLRLACNDDQQTDEIDQQTDHSDGDRYFHMNFLWVCQTPQGKSDRSDCCSEKENSADDIADRPKDGSVKLLQLAVSRRETLPHPLRHAADPDDRREHQPICQLT